MPPLRTVLVASGLSRPVFVVAPPGDTARLFIVEQRGRIRILDLNSGQLLGAPFLRIDHLASGDEQGLLGLAFHPDFANNGRFFTNSSDAEGVTRLQEFRVSADPNVADANSARLLLSVPQPFANHNGGWIAFGPRDGMLYVGLGDGGSANDPGARAQNLGQLLGKMLRIDVTSENPPGDLPYAIPPDNPFVNNPQARAEIWAFGLRNPWRNSFDRQTHDLYIGDVGQDEREEVNFQAATSHGGENYGWRLKEGTRETGLDPIPAGAVLVDPIFEYTHDSGEIAVVGGYVYRGTRFPDLAGTYFLADYSGTVRSFKVDGGQATEMQLRTLELFPGGVQDITSFGEDANGELYICLKGGDVVRIEA